MLQQGFRVEAFIVFVFCFGIQSTRSVEKLSQRLQGYHRNQESYAGHSYCSYHRYISRAQIPCAGQELVGPMSAPAGYGQAVHSGKCAMHKLGIQVLPSLDVMAIVDANDTLRQVAMEDMLAY